MKMSDITGKSPDLRTYKESNLTYSKRCIGLEVELERCDPFLNEVIALGGLWSITRDDSLRYNGAEFKFSAPLMGVDLVTAVNELAAAIKKAQDISPLYCDAHERTSLHAHVDIRDFTWEQIQTIVGVFAVVERVLYRYVGKNRHLSVYSVPIYKSMESVRSVLAPSDNIHMVRHILQSQQKYAGLNLQAINKYGSLEFRMHGGTTSADDMLRWVNILQRLVSFSAESGVVTIKTLPEYIVQKTSLLSFAEEVFGVYAPKLLRYKNVESDLREGMLTLEAVLHSNSRNNTLKTLISKFGSGQKSSINKQAVEEGALSDDSFDEMYHFITGMARNNGTARAYLDAINSSLRANNRAGAERFAREFARHPEARAHRSPSVPGEWVVIDDTNVVTRERS